MIKTYEYVSPMHPDKICDRIADAILDEHIKQDPKSRVAVEVMGGHGKIKITGEITSTAEVDMEKIAYQISKTNYEVEVFVSKQSPEIARGVDGGGAGDQGIMVGYACNETPEYLPLGHVIARDLCMAIFKKWPYDGKTQITLDGDRVLIAVASFQNTKSVELEEFVRSKVKADKYYINPTGEWAIGGFEADSGVTGRKLVVDSYGPYVPIGGGAFSGKDMTKVDRSGALLARKMAVDLLKERQAKEVTVWLAYVIGVKDPIMCEALVDGVDVSQNSLAVGPIMVKF